MKVLFTLLVFVVGCSETNSSSVVSGRVDDMQEMDSLKAMNTKSFAEVIKVTVSGNDNDYQFFVTLQSPDTGCDQYADWWEVISESGTLLYRRILAHSHVNEQPFTRSGGPVDIAETGKIWIIAHMNNAGYGQVAKFGSVETGFKTDTIPATLLKGLDEKQPLPSGCAF